MDHYKSASALFSVTFDGTTTDDISVHALHTIRDMLAGYDTYIDTEVGVDTSADLQSEMSVILVLAAIVIVLVLTLTSRSYAEVPVLIMTFGARMSTKPRIRGRPVSRHCPRQSPKSALPL